MMLPRSFSENQKALLCQFLRAMEREDRAGESDEEQVLQSSTV